MRAKFGTAQMKRGVAVASIILASGCANSTRLFARPRAAAQKPIARSSVENRETSEARPRLAVTHKKTIGEPLVRIGLMTDVTSVLLSSSSGLTVSRLSSDSKAGRLVASGSVRFELRDRSAQGRAVYRIAVDSTDDNRRARKLADELNKKHEYEAAVAWDPKEKEYTVVTGRYESRREADTALARLRRSGYDDARVVMDSRASASSSKSAPGTRTADRTKQTATGVQIAAIEGDKLIASASDELVIAPASPSDKEHSSSAGKGSGESKSEWRLESSRTTIASRPITIRVGTNEYRGEIHLVLNRRGRINVINELPIEEYLRGVVPMELPPGPYPAIEALKAQAIAARTYVLANRKQHDDDGFDLYDDARSQVYGGVRAERELSNRAVEETRGMIAIHLDESGRSLPIQALYTANCGGRTESNEAVFGGSPLSYLRGVACAPDRSIVGERDITTKRSVPSEDRSLVRSAALLEVLGFHFRSRLTGTYLESSSDQAEVTRWIERLATLTKKDKPSFDRGDASRLPGFARLLASAIYGQGRASLLLASADVDYLLAGLGADDLPREARADVAMLLKDGVLRLQALDPRPTLTRATVIGALARALTVTHSTRLTTSIPDLKKTIARGSKDRRVTIASSSDRRETPLAADVVRARGSPAAEGNSRSGELTTREIAARQTQPRLANLQAGLPEQDTGIEVEENAWLFRKLGGESYAVERVTLIGGEQLTYHLNSNGRIDFLEASLSEHGASSDRFSSMAQWTERITREEMERRLARSRINVGKLTSIEPIAFSGSNRVTEVEVIGDAGNARVKGRKIIGALGLRENLWVLDTERDAQGQAVAFVFTGRGWGHGVGLCQTGAYGLAKEGYSHTAILQKYYTGIKLQRMY